MRDHLRFLVNIIGQPAHRFDGRAGQDAVSEIEDMASPFARFVQNCVCLRLHRREIGQKRYRVKIALNRLATADLRPGPVKRYAPVNADHVTAERCHLVEHRACIGAEIDDRDAAFLCAGDHLPRIGCDETGIIARTKCPSPAVEHLHRVCPSLCLLKQIVTNDGRQLLHQPIPDLRRIPHQRFGQLVVFRAATFYRIAGQCEWRAGEPDQRQATRCQFRRDQADRVESIRQCFQRRSGAQPIHIGGSADRVANSRAFTFDEIQIKAHPDQRRQNVREQDRRIKREAV